MDLSSVTISHSTPAGDQAGRRGPGRPPPRCGRPAGARRRPGSAAGRCGPAAGRSSGWVLGLISAAIVAARSAAEIPVVVPSAASTDTVNAVRCDSVLLATISGSSSSSARSAVIGAQMTPEVWARKKAIFSGVAASAAMMRSPSFSRSASSTTTTIPPRRIAAIASWTVAKRHQARHLHSQVVAQPLDRHQPAPPETRDVARTRAREHRPSVVTAGQGGRQVQHVAVHQSGPVEVVGDPCATLDEDLQGASLAELVKTAVRSPEQLERRPDPGALGRGAKDDPYRLARRLDAVDPDREGGVVGRGRYPPRRARRRSTPVGGARRPAPPRR